MPNALQLLVSPRPQRTKTAHLPEIKGTAHACTASFTTENGHMYITERHFTSTNPKAQGGFKAQSGPPPHIHLYQAEYFTVLEGTLGVVVNGKNHFLTRETPEVRVPPLARHRFWPHEGSNGGKGDVVLRVRVDEYDGGLDERFIRNIFSYASDCETYGVAVSLPQMMLFLWAHDIIVDAPLPVFVIKVLQWFVAIVVGKWILGYRDTYQEYYDDGAEKGPVKGKKEL